MDPFVGTLPDYGHTSNHTPAYNAVLDALVWTLPDSGHTSNHTLAYNAMLDPLVGTLLDCGYTSQLMADKLCPGGNMQGECTSWDGGGVLIKGVC